MFGAKINIILSFLSFEFNISHSIFKLALGFGYGEKSGKRKNCC